MKLIFLGKNSACQEFCKNSYLQYYQPLETNVRLPGFRGTGSPTNQSLDKSQQIANYYCQKVLNFSPLEMQAIKWNVKMVIKILKQKANRFIPQQWKFVKLAQGVDWNYPYTLNDVIVLPENKVREMVLNLRSPNSPIKSNLSVSHWKTLFHELVHLKQKENPSLYEKIYHDFWGFRCISANDLMYLPFYLKYNITNPDARQKTKWIIPIILPGTNGKTFWFHPMLILDPENINQQKAILVPLNQVWNPEKQVYQYYTSPNYRTTCSLKEYEEKFYGMKQQLYDPDEIMANLLTDYVIANIEYTNNSFTSNKFYSTVRMLIDSNNPITIVNYPNAFLEKKLTQKIPF